MSAQLTRRVTREFMRFLVSGAANTALTYLVYLGLLQVTGYQVAYFIAYACGILLSYYLNLRFVFRAEGSRSKLAMYPLVYAVQYLLGMAILWVAVEQLGLPPWLAVVCPIVLSIPVTFTLSRLILKR